MAGGAYKLWLVVPLTIVAVTVLVNGRVGIGLLIFFLVAWGIAAVIAAILWMARRLFPKNTSFEVAKLLQEAIGAIVFLGVFALIGEAIRGDNIMAQLVAEKLPDGVNVGFVDPIFAVVCILGVWVYTAFRISR